MLKKKCFLFKWKWKWSKYIRHKNYCTFLSTFFFTHQSILCFSLIIFVLPHFSSNEWFGYDKLLFSGNRSTVMILSRICSRATIKLKIVTLRWRCSWFITEVDLHFTKSMANRGNYVMKALSVSSRAPAAPMCWCPAHWLPWYPERWMTRLHFREKLPTFGSSEPADWLPPRCQPGKFKLLSRVWLFATLWTIQSTEFSRPEYCFLTCARSVRTSLRQSSSFNIRVACWRLERSAILLKWCPLFLNVPAFLNTMIPPLGISRTWNWSCYPVLSREGNAMTLRQSQTGLNCWVA